MIDSVTSRCIDSLRVVCCAVVVLSHVYEFTSGNLANPWNEVVSYLAVATFFTLSGYVNYHSYQQKPGYLGFLRSRASRLLPLYYSAAIASLFIAYAFGVDKPTDWLNLVFAQSIVVPTVATNGPLWSLAWEMLLYLAFPCFVVWFRHPFIMLIPMTLIHILFDRHQILFYAFFAGTALAYYGIKFPRFEFFSRHGRYTYEVYCLHYPLLFLVFSVFK